MSIGSNSQSNGSDSVAIGNQAKATGEKSTAIGSKSEARGRNSVALGAGTVTDRDNTVSVGGRTISNVGKAVHDDAVTLGQARSMVKESHTQVNNRVTKLESRLNHMDRSLKAGIAASVAMANLPQSAHSGKSMISAAVGNYRGQSSVTVGISKMSNNGRVIMKASGTVNTIGHFSVGAGVGYEW